MVRLKQPMNNFKNIKGLDWYKVSDKWEILDFNFRWSWKTKLRKIWINKSCWYLWVKLEEKFYLVHRLVAQAFLWLDISNKKILVCHKDDDKTNNKVENLFLGDYQSNMDDMKSKNRQWWFKNRWENHWANKLTLNNIKTIKFLLWKGLRQWQIWKIFWVNQWHISRIKTWNKNTWLIATLN